VPGLRDHCLSSVAVIKGAGNGVLLGFASIHECP